MPLTSLNSVGLPPGGAQREGLLLEHGARRVPGAPAREAATNGAGPCTVVFTIVEAVPPPRPPPQLLPQSPGDGRDNVPVVGE